MAKVISQESLAKMEGEIADLELAVPVFEEQMELFNTFMEGQKFAELRDGLKDSHPGFSRSVNANLKLLDEANPALTVLFNKMKSELAELKAKHEKSIANKESAGSGGAKKMAGWVIYVGDEEISVTGDLNESLSMWTKGFSGPIKDVKVPARYTTTILKEIEEEITEPWDGNALKIRKDKREMTMVKKGDEIHFIKA